MQWCPKYLASLSWSKPWRVGSINQADWVTHMSQELWKSWRELCRPAQVLISFSDLNIKQWPPLRWGSLRLNRPSLKPPFFSFRWKKQWRKTILFEGANCFKLEWLSHIIVLSLKYACHHLINVAIIMKNTLWSDPASGRRFTATQRGGPGPPGMHMSRQQ